DVDNWGLPISATDDFDPADVNIDTEKITVDIDIPTGSKIRFSSTGVLPGGLEAEVIYYAIRIDVTIIQVASSSVDAATDPPVPIDITSQGVGTHTIDVGEGETLADRQAVIDRVEAQVERITKDYFYPKTFYDFLDGNGRDRLFLSIRQKILSINYMAISQVEVSTIDKTGTDIEGAQGEYTVTLIISTTANYYKGNYLGIKDISERVNNLWGSRILGNTVTDENGKSVFTLEQPLKMTLVTTPAEEADVVSIITNWGYDDDCIYRSPLGITHEPGTLMEPSEFFLNGCFPKGQRNIEIKGTIGHYSCPQAIKNACIILARDENDPTLYEHYEFEKESMGRVYSYDRGGEEYLSGII
ncbi:unnamed protein product, partial [marine sediment metagenome]